MPAPKLPSVFKQHKAKPFSYKPRHYDERKERIDKLRAKHQREAQKSPKQKAMELANDERFRNEWQNRRQTTVKGSNRILIITVVGLLLLAYQIFFS